MLFILFFSFFNNYISRPKDQCDGGNLLTVNFGLACCGCEVQQQQPDSLLTWRMLLTFKKRAEVLCGASFF